VVVVGLTLVAMIIVLAWWLGRRKR
jgi:hypothetical protein